MGNQMTFGKKIGLGFMLSSLLTLLISFISIYSLRSVVSSKDRVILMDSQLLIEAAKLESAASTKVAAVRGYALTREKQYLEAMNAARSDFLAGIERIKKQVTDETGLSMVKKIEQAENNHQNSWNYIISRLANRVTTAQIAKLVNEMTNPKRELLKSALKAFVERQQSLLEEARNSSTLFASNANLFVIAIAGFTTLLAGLLAAWITRSLSSQIGSAIQHVQSSSAELQAAANEQATGSKEQASAVNEIATTIKELLGTSKQIAESSQRVAFIAKEAATAAQAGDQTVHEGQNAITAIKKQTDLIVNQVLELGKRSQQIGSVVDIITELAEQTNILAINATIEAVGAGESGKRFSVVADEIRKLADRVGGSAKDIRALIEEIRGAVNTTVMATESGSKAVESGTKQFGDIARSFQQIVTSITTATQAVREIELNTKQQATAVEQVNSAISSVAQAVHEMEASSSQTLQTSSQLATLSKDLSKMVQPGERKVA